ncbi:MAG: response regulator [Pseudomonadota bacterium]|nr:response regulator [Pseudomonadota bacterium]
MDTKIKFLIVDDLQSMRWIIIKRLKEIGFTSFLEANDGDVALETLRKRVKEENPLEFIISDWNMPNMKGIDLLKEVRKDAALKELPFLMVTAEADQEQMQEALDAGADAYAFKPFTPKELKDKLMTVLQKRNPKAVEL